MTERSDIHNYSFFNLHYSFSSFIPKAYFFAQVAENFLIRCLENTQFIGDQGRMRWKYTSNECLPLMRQVNDIHAPIQGLALPSDETALFQVVDNHGDIAAAAQYFMAEVFLGEGAEVVYRFEYPELADSQSG